MPEHHGEKNGRWKFQPWIAIQLAIYLVGFGILIQQLWQTRQDIAELKAQQTKYVTRVEIDDKQRAADREHDSLWDGVRRNDRRLDAIEVWARRWMR